MGTTIWWIRRDVRLADNAALAAALTGGDNVLPAYILDPHLLHAPDAAPQRVAFLLGGLRALDASLRQRGSRLLVRTGAPVEELARLCAESGAEAIHAEEDSLPYGRRRDAEVSTRLPLHLHPGVALRPLGAVAKTDGSPYVVFTPYSRAWRALPPLFPPLPTPPRVPTHCDLPTGAMPTEPTRAAPTAFLPGEAEAVRRLETFCAGEEAPILRYAVDRDTLGEDGTSSLSPYLRFGMLSARQAAAAAYQAMAQAPTAAGRAGAEAWLTELLWREFYSTILWHFPRVERESFRGDLREIPWRNDTREFAAWQAGRTGYPIVDAGMRQLVQAGWMHNRARMIAASFLVKDLLIDWRWGEQFFMEHLVDGEPASNNGGWQWCAGTGTDAAPYFRVFNPLAQGSRYDPDGAYVRRWVPELAGVPLRFLHAPWTMPESVQRSAGCRIGRDYPEPLVAHAAARQRALAAYRQARIVNRA